MYRRGVAKEYRIKAKLEKEGWIVLRMAGSHGSFDLVAIDTRLVWHYLPGPPNSYNEILAPSIRLIQVKSGKSRRSASKKALKEIEKFAGVYSVTAEVL